MSSIARNYRDKDIQRYNLFPNIIETKKQTYIKIMRLINKHMKPTFQINE